MNYQQLYTYYVSRYWREKYPTRNEYMKAMRAKWQDVPSTTEEIYEEFVHQTPEGRQFGEFPKISEAEQAKRKALTDRAREVLFSRLAARQYSSRLPSTNLRYVEDIMMGTFVFPKEGAEITPDIEAYNKSVQAENERIFEVMTNMPTHRSEAIDCYLKMFRKWEAADPLSFLDHEVTDEEIVDNYEQIHFVSAMATQTSNFLHDLETRGIGLEQLTAKMETYNGKANLTLEEKEEKAALEADIEKLKECNEICNRYSKYGDAYFKLYARMGLIASPYYKVLNSDDINVRRAFAQIENNGSDGLELKGDSYTDKETLEAAQSLRYAKLSSQFGVNTKLFNNHVGQSEYIAAKEILARQGVKPEDIMYTTDRSDEPKAADTEVDAPGGGSALLNECMDLKADKITVFDKNDPDKKVVIDLTAKESLTMQMAREERQARITALPEPPAPVVKPVTPQLSGWKRFCNTITRGAAYETEVTAYDKAQEQFKADMLAYEKYLREVVRYHEALSRSYTAKVLETRPDDPEATAAMANAQNALEKGYDVATGATVKPVEAKTRQVENFVSKSVTVEDVFNADFREPEAILSKPATAWVMAGHVEDFAKAADKYCGLQLGDPNEQARMFFLGEDNRMRSCENIDFLDTKGVMRLYQMLAANRVFVVPAGETTPVQVQLISGQKNGIRFADNLGCPPKEPGFFTRIFNRNSPEVKAYKAAMEQSSRAAGIRGEIDRITYLRAQQGFERRALSNATPKEMSPAASELATHAEMALGEERTHVLRDRLKEVGKELEEELKIKDKRSEMKQEKAADQAIEDFYGPKPMMRQHMIDGESYKEEDFKKLPVYKGSLLPKGSPMELNDKRTIKLSRDDFTAIAFGAASHPDVVRGMASRSVGEDMKEMTCEELTFDRCSSMLHNDIVFTYNKTAGKWNTRPNISLFFDDGISLAREKAAEAVNAYKAGNPELLSRIIARSLMAFERTDAKEVPVSVAGRATNKQFERMVQMVEKDPLLKAMVRSEVNNIKSEAAGKISKYNAVRADLRKQYPDLDECCVIHNNSMKDDAAAEADEQMMKTHPGIEKAILKTGMMMLNIEYAQQVGAFDLNKTMAHVHARQKACDIIAAGNDARKKMELADMEKRPLSAEEKQTYLRAVLKEEVLIQHMKGFKEKSEAVVGQKLVFNDWEVGAAEKPFTEGIDEKESVRVGAMSSNYSANVMMTKIVSNHAFSPVVEALGKTKTQTDIVERGVNALVSPEKQAELCNLPDKDFLKVTKSPSDLFAEGGLDSIPPETMEAISLTLDDPFVPDEAMDVNQPNLLG